MLHTRVVTALLALVGLVLIAWLAPPIAFDLLLLLLVSLACVEWLALLGASRFTSALIGAALVVCGAVALYHVPIIQMAAIGSGEGVLALYGLATLFWLVVVPLSLHRRKAVLGAGLVSRLVAILITVATWVALVQADGLGKGFLLSVLLLVWVADTAAYFAGRAFGRHKLAPAISPGKTWEGVAGAVIANLLLAVVLSMTSTVSSANPVGTFFSWMRLELGITLLCLVVILLTLVSVMGDLYESMLKRAAGVKDSGRLLPGHGGVLDRLDALLAVVPVTMGLVSLVQLGALSY